MQGPKKWKQNEIYIFTFHVIKLSLFALIDSVRIKNPHQSKSNIYGSSCAHGPKCLLFPGALG